MTIEERVELYKSLFPDCKAIAPVAKALTKPDLEAFLHQYRHHLQNEAREQGKKLLLVEDKTEVDSRIPYKEAVSTFYGEDDAVAWARMVMESAESL